MSVAVIACGALAAHVHEIADRRNLTLRIEPINPLLHNRPEGIAIDSKQQIYVCDSLNRRVQRFSPDGMYMDQIDLDFVRPTGVFIDHDDYVYIADTDAHVVKILKWS